MWDLWWTKWRWGKFSPSTSVSPVNLHSTNFFTVTITYHPGLVQQASSGRSTQSPTAQIKNKRCCESKHRSAGQTLHIVSNGTKNFRSFSIQDGRLIRIGNWQMNV
jgi:hypothetical protein